MGVKSPPKLKTRWNKDDFNLVGKVLIVKVTIPVVSSKKTTTVSTFLLRLKLNGRLLSVDT
jgi:hypothetical protein